MTSEHFRENSRRCQWHALELEFLEVSPETSNALELKFKKWQTIADLKLCCAMASKTKTLLLFFLGKHGTFPKVRETLGAFYRNQKLTLRIMSVRYYKYKKTKWNDE